MGVERRRGGDDGSERGGSERLDPGGSPDPDEPPERVHVRRLDVLDTLRWSWEVLGDRRELLAVAFGVNLLSVVAALGVTRPSPAAEPEFADWVLWLYLVQFLALLVAGGAFYLTAADAVANRARPVSRHLVAATKRLPALIGAAVVMAVLVGLTQIPPTVVETMQGASVGVRLFLTLVFTLVGVYVFLRLLLAYPACVVDRTGPIASVRASWRAATGNVRKVFAVGVVYVLATVASNVASSQFGGQYDVASTFVSAAFGAVLFPLFGLALAHLYLEGSRNR